MRLFFAVLVIVAAAVPALAQQVDPRIMQATVVALRGLVTLREAEIAVQNDRIAELEKLCGEPCKPKAVKSEP